MIPEPTVTVGMGEDGRWTVRAECAGRFLRSSHSTHTAPGKGRLVVGSEPGSERSAWDDDARFMSRALSLAENGLGLASPNPLVGAVVVADGRVVGEGWHEGPGTPHAEAMALAQAGDRANGATLYVTLEPCSHFGRTPPCAPLVSRSRVARVVAAMQDPNPLVDGRGFEILRAAGVQLEHGMLQARAARLVAGFAKHTRTGLPFVTLKMAASLDGKVAARDGSSRWITGEAAREDAHRLRAASGAIVVGAGTAVTDGPSLTVRLSGYRGRQPLRVLVDGSGRVPAGGPLFDGTASTLVATTPAGAERAGGGWEAAGAEVLTLDGPAEDRVSLARLMEALGKREIQNVLIEGGPTLAWSAAQEGLIDRIVVYLAPKLIGGAATPGILGGDGVENIADAIALTLCDVAMVGEDLRIESMTNGVEEGTA